MKETDIKRIIQCALFIIFVIVATVVSISEIAKAASSAIIENNISDETVLSAKNADKENILASVSPDESDAVEHSIHKISVKELIQDEETEEEKNEIPEETSYDTYLGYTKEEIDLLALTVMAEAESEPEYGQRLVIDTVLNRVDDKRFPNSIHSVVYQKSQYTGVTGSRVKKCYVRNDFRELVMEELANRSNYDVLYFRTKHYHNFGTPLFQVGGHYFSK